jgi:3-oxosteroid 1-dehydrogenase
VLVTQQNKTLRIGAKRGVILAAGGFEANQVMREQYLPHPTDTAWSVAPGCNRGDGIRAGQAAGAAVEFMHLTWGTPSMPTPGMSNTPGLFMERHLPGCVVVNGQGRRFVNEAVAYTEFVYAMIDDHEKNGAAVPCWLIFDATYRKKYPVGPIMPSTVQPDRKLPKAWENTAYWKADSLNALAEKIGVDADGLAQSVADINRFAQTGVDEQFGKGGNAFDRYYGDPHVSPNPCLASIEKPPFYAVLAYPGEIGTKGGLVTDEAARVLTEDGKIIPGLYATGNCSGPVMGRTYAGPGATLGPAMTFGYLAAHNIASGQRI